MTTLIRDAIFISHANPEDNELTVWLGARLTAAGYEVWADVLRLRGGQDWQRLLEDALRNKACKVLVAAAAWPHRHFAKNGLGPGARRLEQRRSLDADSGGP